jgi:hypothetical protein
MLHEFMQGIGRGTHQHHEFAVRRHGGGPCELLPGHTCMVLLVREDTVQKSLPGIARGLPVAANEIGSSVVDDKNARKQDVVQVRDFDQPAFLSRHGRIGHPRLDPGWTTAFRVF